MIYFPLTLITNPIKIACSGKQTLYVDKIVEIKKARLFFILAKFKIGKWCIFCWLVTSWIPSCAIRVFLNHDVTAVLLSYVCIHISLSNQEMAIYAAKVTWYLRQLLKYNSYWYSSFATQCWIIALFYTQSSSTVCNKILPTWHCLVIFTVSGEILRNDSWCGVPYLRYFRCCFFRGASPSLWLSGLERRVMVSGSAWNHLLSLKISLSLVKK